MAVAGGDGSASVVADGDLVVAVDSLADQSRVAAPGPRRHRGLGEHRGVWAGGVDESEGRVYVATEWEGPGLAALDADTGEEVWSDDDRNFVATLDDGRVLASSWTETPTPARSPSSTPPAASCGRCRTTASGTSGDRVVALTAPS